ncbi:SDR family oxidoreductase [Dyadobacter sp. LHD-138]|uniref:SDR family NAD(P)-dependent oxidoreductase n=1 Tax=Dyadobacter sp. LHD-138 TaxID=3071413 RepID=UPI0027E0C294|nr:SDR family oxidoreductase [Dyadobacter sp. LHD-138]MDQ6480653.1 SDR family oxidoreductase [Dyadobacter sp. LHD-138]
MSFENKTIVITGGAKGIGRACVELFHSQKANVVILDVDADQGTALANQLGERACFILTDVSKESDVIAAVEQIKSLFGAIDILLNNAAVQYFSTVTGSTLEAWDQTFAINVRGGFLCAKYMIPSMQAKGKGVIINMSSVQAFVTQRQVAAYATTKAAQVALTRSIAIDYAPTIRCVAICPGSVDTPLLRDLASQSPDPAAVIKECEDMHLMKRVADPLEIAEFVSYLASDKAAFITGQAFRIDGGLGIMIQGSKQE